MGRRERYVLFLLALIVTVFTVAFVDLSKADDPVAIVGGLFAALVQRPRIGAIMIAFMLLVAFVSRGEYYT